MGEGGRGTKGGEERDNAQSICNEYTLTCEHKNESQTLVPVSENGNGIIL